MCFRCRHSPEENSHSPRAYLMIRNLPRGKSGNQMVNFLMREFLPFAFLFDESWDVHENVRYAPGFVSVARGARPHISYFNAFDSDRFAANGLSKLRKARR